MFRERGKKDSRRYTKSTAYNNKEGTKIDIVKKSLNERVQISPDTQNRYDIHATIHKLVQEGYKVETILNELYQKFPDSKYKQYFPILVMDKIEKNKTTYRNKDER